MSKMKVVGTLRPGAAGTAQAAKPAGEGMQSAGRLSQTTGAEKKRRSEKERPPEKKKRAVAPRRSFSWLRTTVLCGLLLAAGLLLGLGPLSSLWNTPRVPGVRQLLEEGKALLEGGPSPQAAPSTAPPATEALTQRELREAAYQQDREALLALTDNQALAPETREDAAAQLQQMVEAHQQELALEQALGEAGFPTRLVLLQNKALTVMVRDQELTAAESATIMSLCVAHGAVDLANIRIMTGQ